MKFSDEDLETWNDAVVKAAWDDNPPSHAKEYVVYAASKTETEKMAFKWIEENNNPFILNTVLPSITVSVPSFVINF